jgi:hypothetical protein
MVFIHQELQKHINIHIIDVYKLFLIKLLIKCKKKKKYSNPVPAPIVIVTLIERLIP